MSATTHPSATQLEEIFFITLPCVRLEKRSGDVTVAELAEHGLSFPVHGGEFPFPVLLD